MGSCTLPPVDVLRQHDFLLVDLDQHNIIKPSRTVPALPGYQKLYPTQAQQDKITLIDFQIRYYTIS